MANRFRNDPQNSAPSEQNIHYVRQMLGELRGVAEAEKADMLSYLIEMAFMEAGDLLEACRRRAAERA